jgi:hypothetical protein
MPRRYLVPSTQQSLVAHLVISLLGVALTFASLGRQAAADETSASPQLNQQIEAEARELDALQQQLIPFFPDEAAQQRFFKLEQEIAMHRQKLAKLAEMRSDNVRDEAVDQFEQLRGRLDQQDKKFAELIRRYEGMLKHLAESERANDQPPLENATIEVIALKYAHANQAVETIDAVFGGRTVRVAVDEHANSLVVAGPAEAIENVRTLVKQLDTPANAPADGGGVSAPSGPTDELPRSLLLRVYWLADGLPEGEGQEPSRYLPRSVLAAMDQLGLDKPRIVGQTVNSLSRDANPDREAPFTTHVPAVIFKQPVQLTCSGKVWPIRNNTAELDVQVSVAGNMVNTDLSGSLATPLGHFMVLGTANSVSSDAPMNMPGMGGEGMMMEGGGYGGGRSGFAAPGAFAGVPGGVAPQDPNAAGQPVEPKYNTSHFAFVVQVNEAESFADEK